MAYVPGCSYDIFVSYASYNNSDDWVKQFEEALGTELAPLLGPQFSSKESIFFDKRKLEVAQSFPDKLVDAARNSAMLIPILSPHYLTSYWCNRERTEFFAKLPHGAEPAGCLAPILVRPVDDDQMDALFRNAHRFSFLAPDGLSPVAVGSPDWTTRLREFAGQLKNALQMLRRNCKPVFLGKACETDRSKKLRAWCRNELERRYFRTVPETLPVYDEPDTVLAHLQEAALALHFLGGADLKTLEAIETSMSVCAGPTILYQPFGTKLTPDEQVWLDIFERDLPKAPGRYQRLSGKNDQDLVALIDEQITSVRAESRLITDEVNLALVCEEGDLEGVRQLEAEIKTRRPAHVGFPDFLGTRLKAMERLRKWNDYLSHGEALLFYHGVAERNRLELIWQKAQEHRPDVQCKWFLAPPNLQDKREQHPDALWNIDQVVGFLETTGGAHA
jgi:hypothetical protein